MEHALISYISCMNGHTGLFSAPNELNHTEIK
jgi:hypothetical protein